MTELKAATGHERLREIFLDLLDDQPKKAVAI
jgi:hypothetical protein